jgi:Zn-finger nucleic acid-binding protein
MRCPVDGTTLALGERNGVEIDYCPECRGFWLDRGELDRIIDRATGTGPRVEDRYGRHDDDRHYRDHDEDRGWGQHTGRRRGGPLSALGDLLGGGD